MDRTVPDFKEPPAERGRTHVKTTLVQGCPRDLLPQRLHAELDRSSLGQVIEHTTKLSEFFCFSYVLQIYAFKTKVIFKHLIRTRIILVEKGANINQKTNVNEASADVHSTGKIINTSKNPASLEHVSSKSSH